MKKHKKNTRYISQTIRFDKATHNLIEIAADGNFSRFVREACVHYMQYRYDHEDLMEKINPDDAPRAQRTFFEELDNIRETMAQTANEINSSTKERFDEIEVLVKKGIYAFLFHAPEVPEELKNDRGKSATLRLEKLMKAKRQK